VVKTKKAVQSEPKLCGCVTLHNLYFATLQFSGVEGIISDTCHEDVTGKST